MDEAQTLIQAKLGVLERKIKKLEKEKDFLLRKLELIEKSLRR